MAGYTRQSTADIVATSVVRAAPINSEYNKLRDAFTHSTSGTTGHKHDGTSDEGSYVPLIADIDKKNHISVDQTNNRHGIFVEVSTNPVEQVRFQDGLIVPVTDNDIDLGTSSLEYKNVYVDGTAFIDTVSIGDNDYTTITNNEYDVSNGNLTFDVVGDIILDADGGDIFVKDGGTTFGSLTNTSGNLIIKSGTTTAVTFAGANADFAGTLDVTGATVLDSTLAVAGTGTVTGTLTAVNNAVVGGNLSVTGNTTLGNAASDTVTITADVASNIIPSADSTYSLGNGSNYWSSAFIDTITTTGAVTIGTTLDMTSGQINNVANPSANQDAATKSYVDTEIAALVDSAPGALDTLNELAAAIGDDASFSTTLTNSIATKLPLAGGTMSGAIAMGSSKITGLGNPTATGDAVNKAYVDTVVGEADTASASAAAAVAALDSFDDRYLGAKSSAPSVDNDGDALITGALYFNSTTNVMNVRTSGGGWTAAGSNVNGTSAREVFIVGTSSTNSSGASYGGSLTTFPVTYDSPYADVYLNGVRLVNGTDVTVTSGSTVVLAANATAGDTLNIVAYGTFTLSNQYTKTETDAKYATIASPTFTGTASFSDGNITNVGNIALDSLTADGSTITITGNTTFADGAYDFDIASHDTSNGLKLGGTLVTATAAELNIMDGVTATASELNILDGVTATATELNLIDGVTSTTAELNLVDGSAAGTIVNSKAVIYSSGGQVNATSLAVGGTAITSTPAELNILDGKSFVDEDNMASNSATAIASQQSIKAYVDAQTEATTVVVTDSTANTNFPVVFHNESNGLLDDTGALRYNPSTGTLLVPNLSVAGTTTQVDTVTMEAANAVIFEGATADAHETTLTIIDPTADRTINLPNQSGTIPVLAAVSTTAITSTPEELNILDGVTATATELNLIDGVTATTAELNILDGVTSTAAELNILDGVTATAAELNYLDIATLGTSAASKVVTSDANNVVTFSGGIAEDSVTISSSSNAATINLREGTSFLHDLTENVTYTFSNPAASGNSSIFTLKIIQGSSARVITWPSSVDWVAATAPTLTATDNGVDIFVFQTIDGGTTYYGFVAGQAFG